MGRAQAGLHRRDRREGARRASRLARRQASQRTRDPADYRGIGDKLWHRFNPGEGEPVRRYYRALHDAFTARAADLGPSATPLLDELGRTLDELDRLAGLMADRA